MAYRCRIPFTRTVREETRINIGRDWVLSLCNVTGGGGGVRYTPVYRELTSRIRYDFIVRNFRIRSRLSISVISHVVQHPNIDSRRPFVLFGFHSTRKQSLGATDLAVRIRGARVRSLVTPRQFLRGFPTRRLSKDDSFHTETPENNANTRITRSVSAYTPDGPGRFAYTYRVRAPFAVPEYPRNS